MKKLLIVNNNMHIGGVQRALVNLLSCIHSDYEVTLLLFYPEGECMKDIPDNVKVITPKSAYRYLGMTKHDVDGKPLSRLCRSFFAAVTRIFGRRTALRLMRLGQKKLSGYDIAISYLHNGGDNMFYGGCNDFVLEHVSAVKKIAFLHCDYSKCGANTKTNAAQYARFDNIAACSEGCRESFISVLPELAEKTMTVRNCNDFERIASLAESAHACFDREYINIVTVARLGREKGVSRALRAISKLGPAVESIRYHIIGDGMERSSITELINELDLGKSVTLYGEKDNPYGYIKAADLLLIPSFSEGAPLVIDEAASLGTPILSTRTSSVDEMLIKSEFGWVCENSEEGMANELEKLIAFPEMLAERAAFLKAKKYNNDKPLMQFKTLIDKMV